VTVFSDYGDAKTNPMPVRVADDGSANVPLIGPVPVAGLTLDSAERAIAAAAVQRDVYRSPHVTVTMDAQRKNRIIIVGAVQKPGVYEIPRGNSTLLAAIMEAGGLSEEASPEVAIRRPALTDSPPDPFRGETLRLAGSGGGVVLASYDENPAEQAQTVQVNLVSATTEGKGGYYLDDGDVVHVKKRPKRAFRVMGLVNAPGEIELPPDKDVYLLDALALAGERKMQAADSVLVIRRVEGQKDPIKIAISVNEAQNNGASNLRIQEDDVVVVRETPITMAFETLKTFFRFSVGSSLALF
jgi:polysaccharide export outer membrane protein